MQLSTMQQNVIGHTAIESSVCLVNGESTVVRKNGTIFVNYHNASEKLPSHMLLLNDEYDAKTDDLSVEWSNQNLIELWDGVLLEHLKQLRQTKPGSATRQDILKWQESDGFKDLCSAISFNADDIKDGVLDALKNYDFIALTKSIVLMLIKLDGNVVNAVKDAGLSCRECNSRRFKRQMTDNFLYQLRKAKHGSSKWNEIISKMHSDQLRELSDQIGLDISGVINSVKDKLYFIQNPSDEEYNV